MLDNGSITLHSNHVRPPAAAPASNVSVLVRNGVVEEIRADAAIHATVVDLDDLLECSGSPDDATCACPGDLGAWHDAIRHNYRLHNSLQQDVR